MNVAKQFHSNLLPIVPLESASLVILRNDELLENEGANVSSMFASPGRCSSIVDDATSKASRRYHKCAAHEHNRQLVDKLQARVRDNCVQTRPVLFRGSASQPTDAIIVIVALFAGGKNSERRFLTIRE